MQDLQANKELKDLKGRRVLKDQTERLEHLVQLVKKAKLDHRVLLDTLEDLVTRATKELRAKMGLLEAREREERTGSREREDRLALGVSGAGWAEGAVWVSPGPKETLGSQGPQDPWVRQGLLALKVPEDLLETQDCPASQAKMASPGLRGREELQESMDPLVLKGLQEWLVLRDPRESRAQ